MPLGFDVRAQIIWAKDRFALCRGNYHWQHEPLLVRGAQRNSGHWSGDRTQSTLWQHPDREAERGHTQRPEAGRGA